MTAFCPDCGTGVDIYSPPRDEWLAVFCPGAEHGDVDYSFYVLVSGDGE